ncbi:filamentous hemagglutinin N-terminal domain-containing protein, partial [Ideonella livida]
MSPRRPASRPVSRRPALRRPSRLRPLAAALAAALPLVKAGGVQAAPAAAAVPVPAVSWRTSGAGVAAPVNTVNARGGVDQVIGQTSPRAIYQWQSFDIGASSSVTFDMALPGSAALNRVVGGVSPSQIFGQLKATRGGEIYLINANGILFGQGAVVNTGSLVASTLNLSDLEFHSGLTHHLLYDPTQPAFRHEGDAASFVDSRSFVRVESGAQITTDPGGRVFLFAKRVENAGHIETPGGQTVLAGGGSVYLANPAGQALYASEHNPAVPALRGLLVEVGAGPGGASGSVANLAGGQIHTPRGNTTLVGMAVNQNGLIRATTSVTENGSIFLRAQGQAFEGAAGGGSQVRAAETGTLTLGACSLTTITPDTGLKADGSVPTSDGNATFVTSRLDLTGRSVVLEGGASGGAQVVAPGAVVNVRASRSPGYEAAASATHAGGADEARVVLGPGATIDVSGTTDTTVSVSRYFVTTELLGSNDLKDAPLQKDGLLSRSRATLDVRDDSLILGSLESYRAGLQQTVGERLSAGGTVRLSAEGAVLAHADSSLRLDGGRVNVTGAYVRETRLMASDGTLYDLSQAPTNLVYTQALNLARGGEATRFGTAVQYGIVSSARREDGYVEGRAAGSLSVVAPTVVLGGQVQARSTVGERQRQGLDTAASGGRLSVGAVRQGTADFTATGYAGGAVLQSFTLADTAPVADEALWTDPLASLEGVASGASAAQLSAGGFTSLAVATLGDLQLQGGALTLADGASLRLLAETGSVSLETSLRSRGGQVELLSREGGVRLAAGQQVDLAGGWFNLRTGGPQDTTAAAGGRFSASGGTGVHLETGSTVDVSGGAVLAAGGTLAGAGAGSITLRHTATAVDPQHAGLRLQGTLQGQALGTGGSLGLSAPVVQIGGGATASAGTLALGADAFQQGGFASFSVDGRLALDVAAGAQVQVSRQTWQADPRAVLDLASGGRLHYDTAAGTLSAGDTHRDLGVAGLPVGSLPATASLSLASSGAAGQGGQLRVGAGAQVAVADTGSLRLSARQQLAVDGTLQAHAGRIDLTLAAQANTAAGEQPWLWIGEQAVLDVSGVARTVVGTDGLPRGSIASGGSIHVSTAGDNGLASALVVAKGAVLDARGAQGDVLVSSVGTGGRNSEVRPLASAGGSVSLTANADLVVEGDVRLQGGAPGAAGGSLSVALESANDLARTGDASLTLPRELRLTAARTDLTPGTAAGDAALLAQVAGKAAVSAALVAQSGADQLSLSARETLRLLPGADLDLAGTLTLSAQALAAPTPAGADAPSAITLRAAQISLNGLRPRTDDAAMAQPAVSGGDSQLTLASRGAVQVRGHWVTQGLAQLDLQAQGDLILQGLSGTGGALSGSLRTGGDLTVSARQVYPASATTFTLDASGHAVRFTRPDGASAPPATPLSAGGQLVVQAAQIEQAGVLRAPQGQIRLLASERLDLQDGSLTSVSADGLTLPYGSVSGERWTAPDGTLLTQLPGKRIELQAGTAQAPGEVQVAAGATVDLSGGGDLLGHEFVAGKGGSTDVFAGTDGAFALVPGVHSAAGFDTSLAGAAALGRQIQIGAGGPLPAGTYTLLPARYGLQPGAFLVRPAASGTARYDLGVAVRQPDGAYLVGARLLTEGGAADPLSSTWQLIPREVALRASEIRSTSANAEFVRRATLAGSAAAERPLDAGTLGVAAGQVALSGAVDFDAATGGRAGRAEFSARQVAVVADGAAPVAGALTLTVGQLNALGAGAVVLGGTTTAHTVDGVADGSRDLQVQARQVQVDTGGQTLQVSDLTLVATAQDAPADTPQVRLAAGSVIAAAAGGTEAAGDPTRLRVQGDGAAVRLSA